MRPETYKMAMSILLKFQTLKCDISRTILHIEVSDGSFCIFHALSFELNLFFDRTCPLKQFSLHDFHAWMRTTSKIQRNNSQDVQFGPSFAGKTLSVRLIAPTRAQRIAD